MRLLIVLVLAVVAVGATALARGDTPFVADLAAVKEFAVVKEVAVVKRFAATLSGEGASMSWGHGAKDGSHVVASSHHDSTRSGRQSGPDSALDGQKPASDRQRPALALDS